MGCTEAIVVEGLVKRYREMVAVDGISFTIEEGGVFGLLGPNGAGKSTTLEILEGLRPADEGRIEVAGIDVRRHPRRVKATIGVQLQDAGFFNLLSVRETVGLFASFHRRPRPVVELLDQMGLSEKSRSLVRNLSGGQRQRLSIACALVGDPRIVFLDEPTTGLDPQARRALWDVVRDIRAQGRTVVLTTHYMEEAEMLCDRVAIMDHGRILAMGTPNELVRQHVPEDRVMVLAPPATAVPPWLEELPGVSRLERGDDGTVTLLTPDAPSLLQRLVTLAPGQGVSLQGLRLERATLEDVFLRLTGRRLRD